MTERLQELAIVADRALGQLQNAWTQSPSDVVPCDVRLHAALGLLLVARSYDRALRANDQAGSTEHEWAQELIDEALDECSRQYGLR
jgi:hypothetical protein